LNIFEDGLSRLPPIRLISEDETAHDDDGLLTAKPKDNSTDFNNHLSESASNAPEDLPEAEAPKEISSQSSVTSLSIDAPKEAELNAVPSSSKVKPPPPSLLLEPPTPHPSSESFPNTTAHLEISSTPKNPTPVSGDVLLPLIIFSVVKTNPPHLVSNLLFTQRFRNQSVGGEESYCLINLLAVAEFLENVDMAGLGLGDSDKVMRYVFWVFLDFVNCRIPNLHLLALPTSLLYRWLAVQLRLRHHWKLQTQAFADASDNKLTPSRTLRTK
jgi:hypothetical protein